MSNDYYSDSGAPSTSSPGTSSTMRAEFAALEAGFDKLPALIGNGSKLVAVNSGGSGMEAITTTGTGSGVRATSPTLVTPDIGAATGTSLILAATLALAGQLTSTLATGTAPLVIASTTKVDNLHVARATLADSATAVVTNANLTGPITSVGNATAVASQTGTGSKFVMDTSPTLVTPILGVATATSVNKVTFTAPAAGATLTLANGKTLTASNTLTLTATDGATLAIGAGGTLGTAAYTAASAYATVAQATSALAASGGTINGVTIGATVRALGNFTRIVEDVNNLTPALNAGVTVDWAAGGTSIASNGVNPITFANIPSGTAGHVVFVTNFNNVTWPAAVDWGTTGIPSIAGPAYVSLASLNAGVSIPAAIFHY